MNKRIVAAVLALVFVFSPIGAIVAANASSNITIIFNGTTLEFIGTQPVIVDGEVLIPMYAFEQLGFEIDNHVFHAGFGHSFWLGEYAEYLDEPAWFVGQSMSIDHMQVNVYDGLPIMDVWYFAWADNATMSEIFNTEWFSQEPFNILHLTSRGWIDIDVAAYTLTKAVTPPEPIINMQARGFVEIVPDVQVMMVSVNAVARATGFDVEWNSGTQTMTLSRSPYVQFQRGGEIKSLHELAETRNDVRLFWNQTERRLEAMAR